MARRRNRRLKRPHLARSCTNIPSQPVLLYSSSFTPLVFSLPLDRSFPLSALFQHRSRSHYILLCPIYRVDPTLFLPPSPVVSGSPHYSIDPTGKALCRVPFASAERRLRIALVVAGLSICWWKESTCRYPMPASMASHSPVTNEMFPVDRWLNFNRCTIQLPLFRDETTRLLYRWRWRTTLCRFYSIGAIL